MVFTYTDAQILAVGDAVAFRGDGNCGITHRDESGLFTLHGGKKYKFSFGANISGASAGTEVVLVISANGEALPSTEMAYAPSVADARGNVGRCICISVPCCCCYNVSIRNAGTTALTVTDAYLCIEKEA